MISLEMTGITSVHSLLPNPGHNEEGRNCYLMVHSEQWGRRELGYLAKSFNVWLPHLPPLILSHGELPISFWNVHVLFSWPPPLILLVSFYLIFWFQFKQYASEEPSFCLICSCFSFPRPGQAIFCCALQHSILPSSINLITVSESNHSLWK